MVWTPLHRALGALDDQLTLDLIRQACAEHIPESASLDWKRDWPLTGTKQEEKQAKQLEFAKDVAAMANSGGGLIVYGVAERRVDDCSVADRIVSVQEVTEKRLRALCQAIGNLIYPAVGGVSMIPVVDPTTGESVLAVVVPNSASRPHLIHPKGQPDWFAAPWRSGTDTMWMSERQIADEYRERDRGYERRAQELDLIWSSIVKACNAASGNQWLVGVLQPERPARPHRVLQRSQARTFLDWCARNRLDLSNLGGNYAVSAIEVNRGRELRRGLRMFYQATPKGEASCGRVEIHADGTVALAVHRSERAFPGHVASLSADVAICDIEQLGIDLAVALTAARQVFGIAGDYALRVGVEPGTEIFRRSEPMLKGPFLPWHESDRVPNFRTVAGTIGSDTAAMGAGDVLELIRDVVHQTGYDTSFDTAKVISLLEESEAQSL